MTGTRLIAAALLVIGASGCATGAARVPPPSEFSGLRWQRDGGWAVASAWVRNGRFVARPRTVSEVIALDGLYAVPTDGRPGPRLGAAADFDLFAGPPRPGQRAVARIRAGHRAADPAPASPPAPPR